MGICYVKIVDNEFKGLKKVFLVQKKIVNNDFEKSLHFKGGEGVKANLEKVYMLIFFFDGFPKTERYQLSSDLFKPEGRTCGTWNDPLLVLQEMPSNLRIHPGHGMKRWHHVTVDDSLFHSPWQAPVPKIYSNKTKVTNM